MIAQTGRIVRTAGIILGQLVVIVAATFVDKIAEEGLTIIIRRAPSEDVTTVDDEEPEHYLDV